MAPALRQMLLLRIGTLLFGLFELCTSRCNHDFTRGVGATTALELLRRDVSDTHGDFLPTG
jgi:hypothetical protein